MSYRVIDDSFADTTVALPSGQRVKAPSLVAGPNNRSVYLITTGETVPVRAWAAAKQAYIDGVLKVQNQASPLFPTYQFVATDFFEEQALHYDKDALYTLPSLVWHDELPDDLKVPQNRSEGRTEAFSEDDEPLDKIEEIVGREPDGLIGKDLTDDTDDDIADEEPESFFVHLHTHSEHSALDGLSSVEEMVGKAKALGQKYLAITDHGNVAGHPSFQDECEKMGIKPIFGMEAYLVDDRFDRSDAKNYQHLVLWAMNDNGLRNLWAMSTEAYRDGFYGHPRLDYNTLERLNEGVMASSACLRGPLSEPFLRGDIHGAIRNLSRLVEIFDDRFYIEIHANQLEDQIKVNQWLVEKAREYDVPIIAAVDSHYTHADEQDDHQVWISMQVGKDVSEETSLFGGGQKYHMASDEEVMTALMYLGEDVVVEAMTNTLDLAQRCTARIKGREGMPIYAVGEDPEQQDINDLLDLCMSNWDERTRDKSYTEAQAVERFETEFPLLARKGFCGYFRMNADLVNYAKSNGVLVGPGRGSGSGSFVAYLSGITEVDPLENDLLFARFMTEGRTALPDFDIDYPSSRKQFMIDYAQSRWGKKHVVAVGTHTRIRNKGAFRDTARAIRSRLPEDHFADLEVISKVITAAEASTAGLGLSWDELFDSVGDILEPYREKMPYLFKMAEKFHGRLKTYSRHAAGLVIDPNTNLEDSLPMFLAPDGVTLVTQFDKDVLEKLNYVKFDFLNLRNLDTLQDTIDLIQADTGEYINVNKWREEYTDQNVMEMLAKGFTLGVFQLETNLGTRTIKLMNPHSVADIADSTTIGRPGPMRSGMDKMFFNRRNGVEKVTLPDPRLESVLSKTYGVMLYQEDIMAITMVLAGYDDNEADYVRKIMGKKKKELVEEEGKKFVSRAVERGVTERVATDLWAQMGEFSLYCVTGDTQVMLASNNGHSPNYITAEDLWKKINAPLLDPIVGRKKDGEGYKGPCVICGSTESRVWVRGACNPCYQWRKKFQTISRGLYGLTVKADGRIRPCRILNVHKKEKMPVWKVTLSDGKSITASANHKHLTSRGLVEVQNLREDDEIIVDAGYELHQYEEGEDRTTIGERLNSGTVNGAFGEANYGYIDGGFGKLMAWTAQAPDHCEECFHDGSVHRLERAHLDGNRKNNSFDNLKMLCVSCHKKHDYSFNGRNRRWGKGHPTKAEKISSIEYMGNEITYSVVMDDPHIWLANGGIATSNSFNRAHAFSYATLAYWTAWLKYHYPVQYMTACLSTIENDEIPEFVNETRRLGYRVLPPDINDSKSGFHYVGDTIRYGFESIKGIGAAASEAVLQGQPYSTFDDFMARKGDKCNMGTIKKLAHVGAFDSISPNRKALEARLVEEDVKPSERCIFWKAERNEFNLPCGFDWESEPAPIGRTGKPTKKKPPPKLCSKGCRQYQQRPLPDDNDVVEYTDKEIRDIEMDTLGVYLSSSPFDIIDSEDLALLTSGNEILVSENGSYLTAILITEARSHQTRNGDPMKFIKAMTHDGNIELTVFSNVISSCGDDLRVGVMGIAEINKNDRGITLKLMDRIG